MFRTCTTLTIACLLASAGAFGDPGAAGRPAARLGSEVISHEELEGTGVARLFAVKTEEYKLKKQLLEAEIDKRLLAQAARDLGISVAELEEREIRAKAGSAGPEELRAYRERNRARFTGLDEASASTLTQVLVEQQRLRDRRTQFLKELRAARGVTILLEPPRLAVAVPIDAPAKGPADAPVTIVEFSDFQCPFCARVLPTLSRIASTYGDKVRIVFRDLPLLQLHPQAAKAAEAATCAHDQGRFWEMHDRLFANQSKLSVPDLKQHAAELQLDSMAFDHCLDSGRHAAEWRRDAADANGAGLTGTPAFFVNGRLLVGAQPFESFAQMIDEELEAVNQRIASTAGEAAPPAARRK